MGHDKDCFPEPPCLKCEYTDTSPPDVNCLECAAQFHLEAAGDNGAHSCVLPFEEDFVFVCECIVGFLLVILFLGLIYGISHNVLKFVEKAAKRKGKTTLVDTLVEESNISEMNSRALHTGWHTAELTKIENWDRDVHRQHIVGVGLPLYYNFHFLIMIAAGAAWLLCGIVCRKSGLRKSMEALKQDRWNPFVVNSLRADLENEAIEFAKMMYWATLLLWLILLAASARYAHISIYLVKEFDKLNSTMSDYALRLKGLPETLTSENEVQRKVDKVFNSLIPTGTEPVKLKGVSIAYDMVHLSKLEEKDRPNVERLLEHLVIMQDCKTTGIYDEKLIEQANALWGKDAIADDINKVKAVFNDKLIRGSGEAFVVFQSKSSLKRVSHTLKGFYLPDEMEVTEDQLDKIADEVEADDGLVEGEAYKLSVDHNVAPHARLPAHSRLFLEGPTAAEGGKDEKKLYKLRVERYVSVELPDDESTDFIWSNYGMTGKEKKAGSRKTALATIFTFCVIVAFVYVPFSKYLFLPYAAVSASPKPLTSQITGFMVGIANNILGTVFGMFSWSIGYIKRGHLKSATITFSTLTSLWNTAFNLGIALYPLRAGIFSTDVNVVHHEISVDHISQEVALTDFMFEILYPGWLFSGFIIGQCMGVLIPTIQNEVLLRAVFTARCMPVWLSNIFVKLIPYNPNPEEPLTARIAEKIFQWGELALEWDYPSLLLTPSVCFCMLFALSPDNWRLFPRMMMWVSFMYVWHRFIHLRLSKKQMHSLPEVDTQALNLWAIPVSLVAAAWGTWRSRLGYGPPHAVIVIFIAAYAIYTALLALTRRGNRHTKLQEKEEDFDTVAKELVYDWWNSNPMYVLKANFADRKVLQEIVPKHLSKPPMPFEFGKEYHVSEEYAEKIKQASWQRFGLGSYVRKSVQEVRHSVTTKSKKSVPSLTSGRVVAVFHLLIFIVLTVLITTGQLS